MAAKVIVIIGATGTQGGSVVETFLKEPGWKLRGLTRNIDSPASQALTARGVDMVAADLDDVTSLVETFKAAHAVFSVTDFWNPFFNPANRAKLASGQTMLEWTHDYILQQGKNVFDAAAQTDGLQRLVVSALSHATKWSGGKYKQIYHFDAEGEAVDYARERHPELMKKTSNIQSGMYLSNMLTIPYYQPKKDKDGMYVFSTKLPTDLKLPLIAANEDTGPLVKALVDVAPGKTLLAYREWMSQGEFAETWGSVHRVKAKYVAAPEDEDEDVNPLPDGIKIDIEGSLAYMADFGFDGGDPNAIRPKDLGVPLDLGTVADWIKRQDWSAVM